LPVRFVGVGNEPPPVASPTTNRIVHRGYLLPAEEARTAHRFGPLA
jgi:hypothetical protein